MQVETMNDQAETSIKLNYTDRSRWKIVILIKMDI